MELEIRFFTSLREITGRKIEKIQLTTPISVKQLLKILAEKYGNEFRDYIYNDNDQVRDFLSFLINGKNINNLNSFNTELNNGDIFAIIPPVGGG